jgi:phosphate/sulfate permease
MLTTVFTVAITAAIIAVWLMMLLTCAVLLGEWAVTQRMSQHTSQHITTKMSQPPVYSRR